MAFFLVFFFTFLGFVQCFDYTLYSAQWPQSYCSVGDPGKEFKCKTSIRRFCIHGIWPQNNNGAQPKGCAGEGFSYDKVKNIAGDLNHFWPNLPNQNDNSRFWRYEWEEHGRCTGWSVENYFRIAVERAKQLDVLAALQRRGIYPGGEYYINEIQSAFPNKVQIGCNYNRHTQKSQLLELKFCLDRKGDFTRCTNQQAYITNCPRGKKLVFPNVNE